MKRTLHKKYFVFFSKLSIWKMLFYTIATCYKEGLDRLNSCTSLECAMTSILRAGTRKGLSSEKENRTKTDRKYNWMKVIRYKDGMIRIDIYPRNIIDNRNNGIKKKERENRSLTFRVDVIDVNTIPLSRRVVLIYCFYCKLC